MSDLISRSELLKRFLVNKDGHRIPERDCDNLEVTVSIKDVKTIIKEQPTAYDIDKVVEEKLRQCTNIENREYPYFNGFKEGKQVGYNKAIDDFVEKIQWEYLNGCGIKQSEIEFLVSVLSQVAEQLKGSISSENTNK